MLACNPFSRVGYGVPIGTVCAIVREGLNMKTNDNGQWYWFPVTGPDYAGTHHFMIADVDGFTVCNPSPMGQEAAYLIASAPMMLDALRRLVHPAADDTDLDNARDVIARATGAA